jgi:2-amino-4-hydroxy-6-hydroxymethyldihydropteridine diphosphokinase
MSSDSGHRTTDNDPLAYVGLGSNLGDRAGNLLLAVRGMLEAGFSVARLSSIYETEPVGVREQPSFLNMVAELRVAAFSPEQVMARLLRIEYAGGRRREAGLRGPRTIDLDLLLYGDERSSTEFLHLPHPRLHERRFVLAPLAELAPELIHPVVGLSIRQLLSETLDRSEVKRWKSSSIADRGSRTAD